MLVLKHGFIHVNVGGAPALMTFGPLTKMLGPDLLRHVTGFLDVFDKQSLAAAAREIRSWLAGEFAAWDGELADHVGALIERAAPRGTFRMEPYPSWKGSSFLGSKQCVPPNRHFEYDWAKAGGMAYEYGWVSGMKVKYVLARELLDIGADWFARPRPFAFQVGGLQTLSLLPAHEIEWAAVERPAAWSAPFRSDVLFDRGKPTYVHSELFFVAYVNLGGRVKLELSGTTLYPSSNFKKPRDQEARIYMQDLRIYVKPQSV